MKRLLIIDGSNLLFQMFFGMPARIVSSGGKPIQGTLGFVGALLKIIRMTEPTHLLVVFDGENGGQRRALDEEYKANRPDYSSMPEEDSPFSQIDDVYAALDEMHVRWVETNGCEADDVIAGYALDGGFDGEVIISSFDSDFFQLVSQRVSVLRYRGKHTTIFTPAQVRARFGVGPECYADYKALVGDTADNIKGIPKVGAKTAAALLAKFGSLAEILNRAQEIKKPSIRESILSNRERVYLNEKLIRLHGCSQLLYNEEALVYRDEGWTTREVLERIGLG